MRMNRQLVDDGFDPADVSQTRASYTYINESGLPDDTVFDAVGRAIGRNREIASQIEKWTQSLSTEAPTLDVFNRGRTSSNRRHPFSLMAQCAWSVENDDILSTLGDVIEGLTFSKCRFELFDEDQQDFWNQWAGDINLDARLRETFRELYKVSQFYVGIDWGRRVYNVRDDQIQETVKSFMDEKKKREHDQLVEQRDAFVAANKDMPGFVEPPQIPDLPDDGPGRGNRRRKKKFSVTVPTSLTIFDPTKVIPVGQLLFGKERFAYIASRDENEAMATVLRGDVVDPTILALIERKYEPTASDKQECAELGVDHTMLWLFRPDAVFRHTLTRAQYERFAVPRLKSVLPIVQMKDNLRASDRASLIGNTNFIVVITKGSDKLPAKQAEINNLQEQSKVIARLPVLVGDHRLKVEIVSPTIDNTLQESRWQVLDSRLVHKALQTFMPIVQGGNASTGVSEMSRVVARGLESRRHMLVRSLERHLFKTILDKNEGVLDEAPSLAFTPKRITLDFSADVINAILKLRDRGDLSRETMLEEVDFDQDVEVLRRARERTDYDEVFESGVPFASPGMNPHATTPPVVPGQPPTPPAGANVGPNGQPRTEGGRPTGVTEKQPRAAKKKAVT